MKQNKLLNKWAIRGGIILASLDFILLGLRFIIACAIDSPICHEGWVVLLLHLPTAYIFTPLLPVLGNVWAAILISIAGIIQYFIIGYLLGYAAFLLKKLFNKTST